MFTRINITLIGEEKKMKPRSGKNKGVRLQNKVAERLREKLKTKLEYHGVETDKESLSSAIKPAIMGERGVDVHLDIGARKELGNWSIECKNQERWNIPNFWKQTTENTASNSKPLLVVKKNREEPLVVLRFEDFLDMLD